MGSVFTIPEAGTANSITVALKRTVAGSNNAKCAIYKHSDLSLVASTDQVLVSFTTTYAWYTFTFATPPSLTANTEYILVVWCDYTDFTIFFACDAGTTDQGHQQSLTYGTFPNPLNPEHNNYKFSIYCTYTVAEGATYTKTFTSDAQLLKRQTKTATTDARLLKRLTKTLTADAFLKLIKQKQFTTDSHLLKRQAKTFTSDAKLLKRAVKTFSADALLEAIGFKGVDTDALLLKRMSKTFTADALLTEAQLKGFTTDALLLKRITATFTTDAVLEVEVLTKKTFTVDAWLTLAPEPYKGVVSGIPHRWKNPCLLVTADGHLLLNINMKKPQYILLD